MSLPKPFKTVDAHSLELPRAGQIIDVRSRVEFEGQLGHLPGAMLVPLPDLVAKADGWNRDIPLLMVCGRGQRSSNGCLQLSKMGFSDVTNLSGGMLAWHKANAGAPC